MLSLIVPTYNRPNVLFRCLASAQQQRLENFELIVVDNAADDGLRQSIDAFNRSARVPARYVPEPRLGLHNARHAGVRAARGEVLAFTDDDATFDPGWLAAHARAFASHAEMAAAGGPVRPAWELEPPRWLIEFMGPPTMFPVLSVMEPFDAFRLTRDGLFFGVNMVVRRNVVLDLGGFNPDSFGDIWLGDGETGFNRRLWERGLLVGYVHDAVVYHHVPAGRMTVSYFCRRQANDGASDMYARYHAGVPGPGALLSDALRIAGQNAKYWAAGMLFGGRTDPRALRVQMRSARTRAQALYALRLAFSPRLRELVEKRDWLDGAGVPRTDAPVEAGAPRG